MIAPLHDPPLWYEKPLRLEHVAIALVVIALAFGASLVVNALQGEEFGSCADWNSWSASHHAAYATQHYHDANWIAETDMHCAINPNDSSFLAR